MPDIRLDPDDAQRLLSALNEHAERLRLGVRETEKHIAALQRLCIDVQRQIESPRYHHVPADIADPTILAD